MNVQEVTPSGIDALDEQGRKLNFPADGIILAVGGCPNGGLFDALHGKVKELYKVGDCVDPRKILNAIHDAAKIAYNL